MTPKEKCDELISLFMSGINYKNYDEVIIHKEPLTSAKQCALICVDEILKSVDTEYDIFKENGANFKSGFLYYWQQVKTEIEKL
jgi:hypothetical protein